MIQGATPELYSLDVDPGERNDRAAESPEQVLDLSASLEELMRIHAPLGWVARKGVSQAEAALLESLGYSTHALPASSEEDPFASGLPDPYERIGDIELVNEASKALKRWSEISDSGGSAWQRDQLARETLELGKNSILQVQQNNPNDPNVPVVLGAIEDALGNFAAAVPLYERGLTIRPMDSTLHARLATVYAKAGRSKHAVERMEYAISLRPRQSLYYRWLITHLLDTGEFDAATRWMDRFAVALEPGTAVHLEVVLWLVTQRKRLPDG